MARPSRWSHMLASAKEEALNAVEFYNRPGARRPLESFLVHMHIAWRYLLHAEFERDGVDYYYRDKGGRRFLRVDGEKKSWELERCVQHRWPDQNEPVRKNLDLTIRLRNKIEHRYERALAIKSQGFCQSLVINFEDEITAQFGPKHSIAEQVYLPVSLTALSREGILRMLEVQRDLPKHLNDFFLQFRSALTDEVANDRRFELRLDLVQKRAPKSEADLAVSFVNEADLSDEERAAYEALEKSGRVILRDKQRPVSNLGKLRPKGVCDAVELQIPFKFRHSSEFPMAWKRLKVRPPTSAKGKARAKTDERYCVYDEAHDDYVYTRAFVELLVERCSTSEGFKELIGREPEAK